MAATSSIDAVNYLKAKVDTGIVNENGSETY